MESRQFRRRSDGITLEVWDLANGAELHTFGSHLSGRQSHAAGVRAVAITVDGPRAVSASSDNTLKVWDLANGAELHTLADIGMGCALWR